MMQQTTMPGALGIAGKLKTMDGQVIPSCKFSRYPQAMEYFQYRFDKKAEIIRIFRILSDNKRKIQISHIMIDGSPAGQAP